MVKDANGFSLAYIYQRECPGMYDTYFTDEEAFVMANTIAKLPNANGLANTQGGMYANWRVLHEIEKVKR